MADGPASRGKIQSLADRRICRRRGWYLLIIWGRQGAAGAGIATLLATFGLTGKGIGEFFGRAAAKGEEQLWDAEIDWAIAYRFTVLHNPPTDNQLKPRSTALNIDQPTQRAHAKVQAVEEELAGRIDPISTGRSPSMTARAG
jgi:hypothetical protein